MKLQQKIDIVKEDILKRFPNCNYTIRILLWDDGTDLVECRHGNIKANSLELFISQYYNNELRRDILYLKKDETMLVDEKGIEYYKK